MKKSERLAKKMAALVLDQFGIELVNFRLYYVTGTWKAQRDKWDVMPWHGYAEWAGAGARQALTVSVCSWDTMTDLLRHGMIVERDGNTGFEFHCKENKARSAP
jgi:hypothetical protein